MPDDDESPDAPRREIVYAILALVSLIIGISRLADPLPAPLWVKALDTTIALAFIGDWIRRVWVAPRSTNYAWRNSYEILTFIPFTLLSASLAGGDVVRSIRFLRIIRFMRYGRFAKLGLTFARLPHRARHLQRIARNAQIVTIVLTGLITVSLGGAILLLVEREALATQGYGAAFWWSLNLFTTTGYAIQSPMTPAGYVVAGALIVAGIAYIGVLTASLASAILRTPAEE